MTKDIPCYTSHRRLVPTIYQNKNKTFKSKTLRKYIIQLKMGYRTEQKILKKNANTYETFLKFPIAFTTREM